MRNIIVLVLFLAVASSAFAQTPASPNPVADGQILTASYLNTTFSTIFSWAQAHNAATSGVHGVTGTLPSASGTTFTNITLSGTTTNNSTITGGTIATGTLIGTLAGTGARITGGVALVSPELSGTTQNNGTLYQGTIASATLVDCIIQGNDLAEATEFDPSMGRPRSGDVLEITASGLVGPSRTLASRRVYGIVATKPGVVMSESSGGNYVNVAMSGRVPVNAIGPVNPGDLLVSAPGGYARAVRFAISGTVIGKAVSSLPRGETGKVTCFVTR